MKVAVVKLRCRDFPNRRKLCDFMLAIWISLAIFWIWYAITTHDVVYLVSGVLVAVFGIITTLYPMKVEIYEDGVKLGKKFYKWSELRAYRNGDYIILKAERGVIIPLPASKLTARAERFLQEIIDNA